MSVKETNLSQLLNMISSIYI